MNTLRSVCGLLLASGVGVACAQNSPTEARQFEYDANGNLTRWTDGRGTATGLQYDRLGRLAKQVLPSPDAKGSQPTIQFDYDLRDQLIQVRDPRNLSTRYAVNGLRDPVGQISPDSGSTNRTFDEKGNLISSKDARGFLTRFEYDALHRVSRVIYPAGAPTTFEYDGSSPHETGRLTKMTDSSGQTNYHYDELGRLIGKSQSITHGDRTNTYRMTYEYGSEGVASGKVVRLAYPSGNRIAIAYGANGKVSSLTLEAAGSSPAVILSELQYEPFGPPRAWKWGGAGGTYLRKFDGHGRLAQYPLGNLHSGGVVRSVDYDESGRIRSYMHTSSLEVTAQASRLDQFFTYDSLDRLRAFQAADTSQAFEYDANGNRTRATFGNTSYTNLIAPNSNRLSSASGPAPAKFNSYDASGNLVSNGERIFKYDERGRLASVRTGLSTVSYSYNGIGERIQKSGPVSLVPGGVNQYFYDLAGNMLGEYDAAGRVVEETIFLEGVPVAVLKGVANSETHSPKLFHVFADHLGAPRVITDAHDGKIVWRWDKADPFGMALPLENIEMGRPFTYNRRFPGQYCDRESNLHYNYYRDYDPQTGRYIESDPIGLEGGINTYTYVGGNPIQRVDYKGESWGAVVPAILVGYAWYEFSKAEREGEKSSAAYVAAEAAYNACLKRMASGVNCNCQLELNAKNAAYLDLVGNALEAGKAANGLFRSKLPVGPTGNIPRPTAD